MESCANGNDAVWLALLALLALLAHAFPDVTMPHSEPRSEPRLVFNDVFDFETKEGGGDGEGVGDGEDDGDGDANEDFDDFDAERVVMVR